mmetsp:Transcript_80719/g.224672  ORF Transcript_80719/g.224672 Transcript_80719/m.224672 type:complete len:334 (-) Transcript_80719:289-1290(-)
MRLHAESTSCAASGTSLWVASPSASCARLRAMRPTPAMPEASAAGPLTPNDAASLDCEDAVLEEHDDALEAPESWQGMDGVEQRLPAAEVELRRRTRRAEAPSPRLPRHSGTLPTRLAWWLPNLNRHSFQCALSRRSSCVLVSRCMHSRLELFRSSCLAVASACSAGKGACSTAVPLPSSTPGWESPFGASTETRPSEGDAAAERLEDGEPMGVIPRSPRPELPPRPWGGGLPNGRVAAEADEDLGRLCLPPSAVPRCGAASPPQGSTASLASRPFACSSVALEAGGVPAWSPGSIAPPTGASAPGVTAELPLEGRCAEVVPLRFGNGGRDFF